MEGEVAGLLSAPSVLRVSPSLLDLCMRRAMELLHGQPGPQKPRPTEDVLSYGAACRLTLLRDEGSSPVAVVELGAQPGVRVCLKGSHNLNT